MSTFLTALLLTFLFIGSSTQLAIDCHPTPQENVEHYIIGYGSLINVESKNRTSPDTGINIPVKVNGYQRTWTARGYSNSSLSTTYLGAQADNNSYLNGVIFTVANADALKKYDQRERLYCRRKVLWSDIKVLRGNISDNGTFPTDDALKRSEFWIYETMSQFAKYPDETYPIVQSYVDIFLGGCIQMERKYGLDKYADDCFKQTKGWDYPWVNDRIHPRRAFAYQSEAGYIDNLISRFIPDYRNKTYVERIYRNGRNAGSLGISGLTPLLAISGQVVTFLIGNRKYEIIF